MTFNRIQFQKGLSIPAFVSRYGSEAQCVQALMQARWPNGFVCPQCGHTHTSDFERGHQPLWQCTRCRVQTSLTAGTPMADTKLPLRVWWLAIYLVSQAKNGIAALELARQLGVCYRTAWRIKHKVMAAMANREHSCRLAGQVQIDDAYRGGRTRRWSRRTAVAQQSSVYRSGFPAARATALSAPECGVQLPKKRRAHLGQAGTGTGHPMW